ncbi:MAG: ABC transporter substrate-binding protein [Lachnospiraceae bacterium]|nr:ABC transporter substrate-binding protein [Lachnospiraceae bacterium]MBQ7777168.1 ABC transporter substrate-binding protein [Lachnospiraceae bacterium]
MKKWLVAGLGMVMALSMLTACGSTEAEKVTVRVGGMKGPTSMGLLFLKEEAEQGEALENYEFTMVTAADELLPLMIKGEMDIALVPANVASVLYNKTEGGISVIDINTLGVLYMVSGDDGISKVEDLKGKTIYLTGKGTTPDYVLHYILSANGLTDADVTLEYKSEATEVAALLAEKPEAIGLLPQPFVTVACSQNEALSVVMDMNEQWSLLQGEDGSRMVTGVTVVRNAFLEENETAVKHFLQEHKESTESINADVEKGAELAVNAGIIAKAPIAQKAIPKCNITYIDGAEMKQALSGYLQVLFEQEPTAVGGKLPEDGFYYLQ